MGFWETMLTSLIIAVALPIVFSVFWFFKVREEKKARSGESIRTRPPKLLSAFFLGFALLVLCGGIAGIIYCCITDSDNTTASKVIIISIFVAVFSAIGFFGYVYKRQDMCWSALTMSLRMPRVCLLTGFSEKKDITVMKRLVAFKILSRWV